MIDTTFSTTEYSLLNKTVSHKLDTIISSASDEWSRIYGNLCLKFDDFSLELNNEEISIPFYDTYEELALFKLREITPSQPFNPLVINTPLENKSIGEIIEEVIIVEDEILTTNSLSEPLYDIKTVTAIIFKTPKQYISLGREWFFSELITLSQSNTYLDKLYPISKVIEDWTDEESDIIANCKRTFHKLK